MLKISLPTDLCRVMLRDRLSPMDQLAFLEMIINRQINMSGVFQSDDLDCLHIIQSAGLSPDQSESAFANLTQKGWLCQDQDIVFIPMVPYVSLYHKHARKISMHRSVMKFRAGREDNRALIRYAQYMNFWDKQLSYDSQNQSSESKNNDIYIETMDSDTTNGGSLPTSARAELESLSVIVPNIEARLTPLELYTLRYITDPAVSERINPKRSKVEPIGTVYTNITYPMGDDDVPSTEAISNHFTQSPAPSLSSSSISSSSIETIPTSTLERGGAGDARASDDDFDDDPELARRQLDESIASFDARRAALHGENVRGEA